jgi:hypothetical protein
LKVRRIKLLVEAVLAKLSPIFEETYAVRGRPSVGPKRLLKASLLLAFSTVRSSAGLMSDDHFTVDGTPIDAWASMKRLSAKGCQTGASNQTHESKTDSESELAREAQSSHRGSHVRDTP